MSQIPLSDLRREFSSKVLSRATVAADPFIQFGSWLDEALSSSILDANAMLVATADGRGRPSARIVLLKSFDASGFTFFTNYESRKGRDLEVNPNVALHFFWPELERQVGITGIAEKISHSESEEYFNSRPLESRLGAWASDQSRPIPSRDHLVEKLEKIREEFPGGNVPLPPYWGGYRVTPDRFEFWQGGASRLHDRIIYTLEDGRWTIGRIAP
ncbi:MAG: pyridoxamine 5'-phosphate oxidase [Acidobacteriota bacterium]